MAERALRVPDVIGKTGLGRTTLWRKSRAGEFPTPRKMGGVVYWLESEIDEWLRSQPLAVTPRDEAA